MNLKNILQTAGHFILLGAVAYVCYKYPSVAPVLAPTLASGNAVLPSLATVASNSPSKESQ